MKNLKHSLHSNEAVNHMDWSENYELKYHEEVQSMHFGSSRRRIALHRSVLYLHEELTGNKVAQSFCTIRDNVRHDAAAVWAHLKPILNYIYHTNPNVDTIHILTDSPSNQYRNKKIFWIMNQLHNYTGFLNKLSWNYSESGHGKGAADGVSAVLKRTADSLVNFGQDIGNFDDFHNLLKQSKIEVVKDIFITAKLKSIPLILPSFKGTLDVHQVLWDIFSGPDLTFRKFCCFSCGAHVECEHGAHLGFHKVPDITESAELTMLAATKSMRDNIPFCGSVTILHFLPLIKDLIFESHYSQILNPVLKEVSNILPETLCTPSTSKSGTSTNCDFDELVPVTTINSLSTITSNASLKTADWILIKKSPKARKHQIPRIIGVYGDNIQSPFFKNYLVQLYSKCVPRNPRVP
ncbi:hypothetical protein O3G_MSEX006925 [Manduca sexta]|uniref:Uncharacterized protein n=1 Tax=Manduca sexta TaxID=7130 RepID=A0A921Z478_MANSE|nr:hypothetical protein O3G_MSEX006925 [Manduca sexta]